MSALVGVAACLCALSVFVATGLNRADACKIAGACKREAVLVAAAGRSVVDALTGQAADSHRHAHLAGVASVHIGPAAGSRRDDVGRNT